MSCNSYPTAVGATGAYTAWFNRPSGIVYNSGDRALYVTDRMTVRGVARHNIKKISLDYDSVITIAGGSTGESQSVIMPIVCWYR